MKKRIQLISAVAAMIVLSARAERSLVLTVECHDGSTTAIEATGGLDFQIDNENMLAVDDFTRTRRFAMGDVAKLYFTGTSGVVSPEAVGEEQPVEVYTLSGTHAGTFANTAAAKASLESGMYICRQGGATFKIAVR